METFMQWLVESRFNLSDSYAKQGGWKLHLAVAVDQNYDSNVKIISNWLGQNLPHIMPGKFPAGPRGSWKYLGGGEKGLEDFTIYIGSRDQMQEIVSAIEHDLGQYLGQYSGHTDQIVGRLGKIGARFDTKGTYSQAGSFDKYGLRGIPMSDELGHVPIPKYDPQGHENALRASHEKLTSKLGAYYHGSNQEFQPYPDAKKQKEQMLYQRGINNPPQGWDKSEWQYYWTQLNKTYGQKKV